MGINAAGYNRHRSRQVVGTPPELIAAAEYRYGRLEVDLAALPENAKAHLFITPDQDSLITPWPVDALCWLNPPYEDIGPWVAKCYHHVCQTDARILVCIPASIGSNWFRDHVYRKGSVVPLNGRPRFQGYDSGAGKDHMIIEYGFANRPTPMKAPWDWMSDWART